MRGASSKKNHRDETGQFDKSAIAPKLQKNNLRPAQCSRGRVSALTLGGCGFIVVPCCLPDCHSVFGLGLGRFDHPLVPRVKFWMGQITFNAATETGKFDVDPLASSRATSSPVTKKLCLTHASGQRHETEHGNDRHR